MTDKPKVVSIRPGLKIETPKPVTDEPEVHKEVVETFKELLAHAESGELQGLAIALAHREGHSDYYIGKCDYALIGVLESLKLQLLAEMAEEEDEADDA